MSWGSETERDSDSELAFFSFFRGRDLGADLAISCVFLSSLEIIHMY